MNQVQSDTDIACLPITSLLLHSIVTQQQHPSIITTSATIFPIYSPPCNPTLTGLFKITNLHGKEIYFRNNYLFVKIWLFVLLGTVHPKSLIVKMSDTKMKSRQITMISFNAVNRNVRMKHEAQNLNPRLTNNCFSQCPKKEPGYCLNFWLVWLAATVTNSDWVDVNCEKRAIFGGCVTDNVNPLKGRATQLAIAFNQ